MSAQTDAGRPVAARVAAIDLLRGLVIVIMALDHARDYFSVFPYQPTDLSQASATLFLTRWITHFCAPVFVFLAGTSAWLHSHNAGLTQAALQRFLLTRGLWLVFLDLTWNSFMWRFDLDGVQVQVLWALGWSMVFLAVLLPLPRTAIVVIGAIIVGGHNLLDGIHAADFGAPNSAAALAWDVLHEPHFGQTASGFQFGILYPLLPGIGVMALGYGFGPVLAWERARRERCMAIAGLALIALFLLLRLNNGYGESNPPGFGGGHVFAPNPRGALYTWLGLLNLSKYPPSLQYLLMTLGPALLLMPLLERWRGRGAEFFTVFGRVPMFFYLLHVPLIHLASVVATHLMFGDAAQNLNPQNPVLPGYTPSLVPVYLGWIAAVAILYPACRWYAGYKQRHKDNRWLSYL